MENIEEYLQPSRLCDFDRCPEIGLRAEELTADCRGDEDRFSRIFCCVRELPYGLDDWDVPASQTLAQGWGMCSGKTNLLVAMLRSAGIAARYRVYSIVSEASLWQRMGEDEALAGRMGSSPEVQDHVDCQVWLGGWRDCDPGRDTLLERGLTALGIPLRRQAVADDSGRVNYLILASFDEWAGQRQQRRRFREDRSEVFALVNEGLQRIRSLATD